jgi:uncharacterized repeat protein (TIGR04052 family)
MACLATLVTVFSQIGCSAPAEDASTRMVSIRFEAMVGDEPFACGEEYTNVGVGQSSMTPIDLRFYIHDVRLVRDDGESVPVELVEDGRWQRAGVALLDFEDRTGRCDNGTSATNRLVEGSVLDGEYRALAFTLGVPFELNHLDASTASAPLNLTAMFWSWNAGYKFLRLDAATAANPGFRVHLGSTGCVPAPGGGVAECRRPNRVSVYLEDFDPDVDVVVADIAALLASLNLDHVPDDGPPGCMSEPHEPGCGPVFDSLGLVDGQAGPEPQRFFRRK